MERSAERARDLGRLVEAALAKPPRVQWHRHERVDAAGRVAQVVDERKRERAAEPARAAVLQRVHVTVERCRVCERREHTFDVPRPSAPRAARDGSAEPAALASVGDAEQGCGTNGTEARARRLGAAGTDLEKQPLEHSAVNRPIVNHD